MLELHDINVFSLSGIFLKLVRESNVYLDIIALKAQIVKNKEVVQEFQGLI